MYVRKVVTIEKDDEHTVEFDNTNGHITIDIHKDYDVVARLSLNKIDIQELQQFFNEVAS